MAELERQLAKLTLKVLSTASGQLQPVVEGFDEEGKLEVLFNPTEYSIDRETNYAEVAIPGLDAPVLQYVRGNGDKMTFELFLDITDYMVDGQVSGGASVREIFVHPLEQLMVQNPVLHAPPPIRVLWGHQVVIGRAVATSLSVKYTLFDTGGRPVRATANLTLRQHTSAAKQLAEARREGPTTESAVVVREGDTLPMVAFREYGDASAWKPIAQANGLSNPLDLNPGDILFVPNIL